MTERLKDEALNSRLRNLATVCRTYTDPSIGAIPEFCRICRICGHAHSLHDYRDALEELEARRAADPTEAQRAWYQDQADYMSRRTREAVLDPCWHERDWDGEYVAQAARLAAHFGRLAQRRVNHEVLSVVDSLVPPAFAMRGSESDVARAGECL